MQGESKENSLKSQNTPLTSAQRKAKQREKLKAIKSGDYQVPLIEQAKSDLKDTLNYNLAELLVMENYANQFSEQELKQLKIFISNQRAKSKKELSKEEQKEQQQLDLKEKAQRLGNQQIPQLHQSLLSPQNYDERKYENLFLFLSYMEIYQSPTTDFLDIILDLCQEFDQVTSTQLFIRVCAMHRGENLNINDIMVKPAMQFLIENKTHNLAAYGLLRLVYQNDLSFFEFPIELLLGFQQQYEQTILNFFKSIPKIQFQVILSMPATCFCFTAPLLNSLKSGGDILHTQIPYQFLPYIIEIICYSFTNNQETFLAFLQTLKQGCKRFYDILLENEFDNLLQVINEKTKQMHNQFFKTLSHSTKILERAFELLGEKKIEIFDNETIGSLINSNNETYLILKQQPKLVKEGSKKMFQQIVEHIKENNINSNFKHQNIDNHIQQEQKLIFKAMGIKTLLPIQQICFQYCINDKINGIHFIQYDTGQGKTSLCLSIASVYAKNGKNVFIINKSEDLTFRDYKKSCQIQMKLNLEVQYIQDNRIMINNFAQINYATLEEFIKFKSNIQCANISNFILIIDEYDSIFFDNATNLSEILQLISAFPIVFSFSGSKIEEYQKQFLKTNLKAEILDFTLNQNLKIAPICHFTKVFHTIKDYKQMILDICKNQLKQTPIVLILSDYVSQIKTSLIQNGFSVEDLSQKESTQVDSSLQIFTEKQKLSFQVFILNEKQGRGLDFLSNSEIEQNGGVYIIIGCLPLNYLQYQQFIGRTARIGNKGQYSVILFDKQAKNQEGAVYLSKKLIDIQNNDLLNLTKSKILTQQKQEDPNEQQVNDQNRQLSGNIQNDIKINMLEVSKQEKLTSLIQKFSQEDHYEINNENDNENQKFDNLGKKGQNQITLTQNLQQKRAQKFGDKIEIRNSKRLLEKISGKEMIDKLYYESYSDLNVHNEMLNDKIRVEKYQQAIERICKDKIIIDVGCGTGILSLFAA